MNLKRSLRTITFLLMIGAVIAGLTACRVPASKGPFSETPTSEGLPVPGETSGGIDVGAFATQTAQANPPVVITTQVSPGSPTQGSPYPGPTNVPGVPEPTSTPLTYVEPTPGGVPTTYTLQEGEYPFCIARRFDVNQTELLTLNGLTVNSFFYAGQELKIPQTGNPFDGSRTLHDHPTTYKIQTGDTVNSIACYFGDVSPDMIILQNNLHSTDLPVGEVLIIP
jgi:LysM repeat protein